MFGNHDPSSLAKLALKTPNNLGKIHEKRLSKPSTLEKSKLLENQDKKNEIQSRGRDDFQMQAKRLSKEFAEMRMNRTPSKMR